VAGEVDETIEQVFRSAFGFGQEEFRRQFGLRIPTCAEIKALIRKKPGPGEGGAGVREPRRPSDPSLGSSATADG
jgi:hypothetical protein